MKLAKNIYKAERFKDAETKYFTYIVLTSELELFLETFHHCLEENDVN